MAIDAKWLYEVRQEAHKAVLEREFEEAAALYLKINDGASATAVAILHLAKVKENN